MRWVALAGAAMLGVCAGTEARADNFRLSIGAGHPVGASAWITTLRDFFGAEVKKRVKDRTGHDIEWVEVFGGSVCKLGECLEAVQDGLLDIADLHVPFEPTKLMAHNFPYFAPFGEPDPVKAAVAARKVFDEFPALKDVLEKKYNQIYLATGTVGNYNLVTTFSWDKVEQLAGHKIAAAGPNMPWLQNTKAVPVQSNLNEAYTSLQTGVYEGWVMFPDAIASFKLHEVAPNYTFTDFGAIPNVLITINRDTWRKLPQPVRDIMLEVGREYTVVCATAVREKGEASIATVKQLGGKVRNLSMDEKRKWAMALPDIAKERAAEITKGGMPGDVIYAYVRHLKEGGLDAPRDWSKK
jgi:TRAP-type C4-dicarboxylate transport system substrate-binding protein